MCTITELERMAAAHWRGTEERWLGDWLLRAADGFTGRANSAISLGDPGVPLDEALAVVTDWYRARGLPPMIAVPAPLEAEQGGQDLDNYLAERLWSARPGPAFVMVADVPPAEGGTMSLPEGVDVQVADQPDDAWAAMYHYRGQGRLPAVARKVLTPADSHVLICR